MSCLGLAASQGWAAWCPVSVLCQELEVRLGSAPRHETHIPVSPCPHIPHS